MPQFRCQATVTSIVTAVVEAASIEEAREKFKAGEWDDYDEDGGEVQTVECNLSTVELDDLLSEADNLCVTLSRDLIFPNQDLPWQAFSP